MGACGAQAIGDDADNIDVPGAATEFCRWAYGCVDFVDAQYESIQHCIHMQDARYGEPEGCALANADLRVCFVDEISPMSCKEASDLVTQLINDPKELNRPDVPCGAERAFWWMSCQPFKCNGPDAEPGATIDRLRVCDVRVDCPNERDEQGCP